MSSVLLCGAILGPLCDAGLTQGLMGRLQEAILFLQRLASLARNGWMRGPLQQRWETTFLEMIHSLCTATNLPQALPTTCVLALSSSG